MILLASLIFCCIELNVARPAQAEDFVPTVTWDKTSDSTIAGKVTVTAHSTNGTDGITNFAITTWCFTLSGRPFSENAALVPSDLTKSWTTFDSITGCYWNPQGIQIAKLTFEIADLKIGTTQIGARVEDENLTRSGIQTLALVVDSDPSPHVINPPPQIVPQGPIDNTPPTVVWDSPDGGAKSTGIFTVSAKATSNNKIQKWCITADGNTIRSDLTWYPSDVSTNISVGTGMTKFDVVTGCYTSSDGHSLKTASFTFPSNYWQHSGVHTLTVQVTDEFGNSSVVSTMQESVVLPQDSQNVAWNDNLQKYVWKSGSNVDAGAYLSGGTSLPKQVQVRLWQVKSGWSQWQSAQVRSDGYFHSKIHLVSPATLMVAVPKNGVSAASTSKIHIDVYGTVKISAPKRVKAGTQIYFNLSTEPKWDGYLDCDLTIDRFDLNGYYSGSSYYAPTVKIRRGIGTLNPGAWAANNSATLTCGLNWAGMLKVKESLGSATVHVY